jgi:hypothetical protein
MEQNMQALGAEWQAEEKEIEQYWVSRAARQDVDNAIYQKRRA